MVDEDWDVLVSFLPQGWRELARDTGALKGLRKDKTVDNLLRTLLLHLGCGHSLRETVVRARQAHLADLSDVALLKRLKKSKGWLHALCVRLFEEQGLAVVPGGAYQIRAVDATTVKEPGPSGSLWRLHYSVGLPSLTCLMSFQLCRAGDGGLCGRLRRPAASRSRAACRLPGSARWAAMTPTHGGRPKSRGGAPPRGPHPRLGAPSSLPPRRWSPDALVFLKTKGRGAGERERHDSAAQATRDP